MPFPDLTAFVIVALSSAAGYVFARWQHPRGANAVPPAAPLAELDAGIAMEHIRSAERERMGAVATVTHELKTPLAGMIGMANLLLEADPTPEQATYAEAIRASGDALMTIVDDILSLAAADAGKREHAAEGFAPAELAEQIVELLAPRALEKGLEIAASVGEGVPALVRGDAARIRQILLNLAGNAVKYTSTGGVGLRIDRTDRGLRFAVHDTGPGLSEELRETLFQPFERGENAAEPGTGLGLAIARQLTERLGGALSVESAPGRGSTFAATLPLDLTAPQPAEPVAALEGVRVIIAAATCFEAPWISERLSLAGADIVLADSAASAMKAIMGAEPAVAVIDRALPGADGVAIAARTAGHRTVALVTPHDRRDLLALHKAGYEHYLVKPVRARSLIGIVGSAARGAQIEQAVDAAPAHLAPEPGQRRARVLLVEDEAVNALLAQAQLVKAGYAVDHVADGLAAVAAFSRALDTDRPFDLVLLDLRLPGLDGRAVARHMRAIEEGRERDPVAIVALSAESPELSQADALAAGMDGFLHKPLDRRALARLVRATREGRALKSA